jgi:hypothetical protein
MIDKMHADSPENQKHIQRYLLKQSGSKLPHSEGALAAQNMQRFFSMPSAPRWKISCSLNWGKTIGFPTSDNASY